MELETAMGYLVALAVPLWLLVEQGVSWYGRRERAGRQVEKGRLFDKPVSSPAGKARQAPAMGLVHPRKSA